MSGNKYNTELEKFHNAAFTRLDVKEVEIRYTGLYGDSTLFKGTINQAIRHLTKLAN